MLAKKKLNIEIQNITKKSFELAQLITSSDNYHKPSYEETVEVFAKENQNMVYPLEQGFSNFRHCDSLFRLSILVTPQFQL